MATVTLVGSFFTTNTGTKAVTQTPAVGDLIVIITAHTGNTSATAPTDNNGSGTYTSVESRLKVGSANRLEVWIRTTLIPAAVSTVFTHAPGTSSGGGIAVLKITGMTRVGSGAKVKSGGQDNQTTGVPTVTWTGGGNADTNNAIIGAVFSGAAAASITPPTGFSEITKATYTVPTTNVEVVGINGGFTGASITWGNNPGVTFASVALELDASSEDLPLLVSRMVGIG